MPLLHVAGSVSKAQSITAVLTQEVAGTCHISTTVRRRELTDHEEQNIRETDCNKRK
jgi:hypothetical protein